MILSRPRYATDVLFIKYLGLSAKISSMNYKKASIEKLIAAYEAAAIRHADEFTKGNIRASNRAAGSIARIYRELRERGDEARMSLLPLLQAEHRGVRGWAAAHALEFAPEKGCPVLEELSNQNGFGGFSALMTLKVWRRGELRFP